MTGVWSGADTSPDEIDGALRRLLTERGEEDKPFVPARVINLVAIVDRDFSGEIENRLERVGRHHPSRTIICKIESRRDQMDAWASILSDDSGEETGIVIAEERIELEIGPSHVERLETIVDPLVVPDLETLVWSPHGHPEAIDALLGVADVVLIDSVSEPDPAAALTRAGSLLESAYVVDLAWVRGAPWRERIAATFDPPVWRRSLSEISAATVRHHPDSLASGALLLGWFSSRLGWEPTAATEEDGGLVARVRARGRRVRLRLEADETMPVPGLSGITIETAGGLRLSLDRGPGGLNARRKLKGRPETSWVVVGASRGESGILGEGIRQALLRDPTYGPALACASKLLSA